MKIHEYYQTTAKVSLNGSIASLFPAILIVGSNLSFFHNKEIMALTLPFLIYSLICFQIYLFRIKQSVTIEENMTISRKLHQNLFEARHLLVVYLNTQFPRVLLYFPDGHLAGELKKYRGGKSTLFNRSKLYVLYNYSDQIQGFFKINGSKKIEVFNVKNTYLGCFEKTKKGKEEFLNASGKYIGEVEGAPFFMDERIYDNVEQQLIRLRRGWMPVEWSRLFPDPNTPVLTFSEPISEKEKLLRMSFLINEFFIKR
jgi:hypothetical protein